MVTPPSDQEEPKEPPSDLSREQLRNFLLDFLDLLAKTKPPAPSNADHLSGTGQHDDSDA